MTKQIIDNSILSSVAKCSTQAGLLYAEIDGKVWRPQGEGAELRAGSDVHEALARWIVTGGDSVKALRRLKKRYEAWADEHVQGDDQRLAYVNVSRILANWFETHPYEDFPFALDPEHVEMAWQGEMGTVGGVDVTFVALLDAIARRKTGGAIFPLDHKTGKGMTEWWKERQEDSSQFSGQVWLAPQNGYDEVAGIVINGIEIPKLNSSSRRCGTHGVAYSECALAHLRHQVLVVQRSRAEVRSWERSAKVLIEQFLGIVAHVGKKEDLATLPQEGRFNGSCAFCGARPWCRLGRPVNAIGEFLEEGEPWRPLALGGRRGGVASGNGTTTPA